MAAGSGNPILGPVAFVAIKVAGYTAAAVMISRWYGRSGLNPWLVGGVRTVIGIAVGMLAVFLATLLPTAATSVGAWGFLLLLVPIRLFEWWLLVWLFYDRALARPGLGWKVAALGTLWSFLLDIPSIVGLVVVGDFWIC